MLSNPNSNNSSMALRVANASTSMTMDGSWMSLDSDAFTVGPCALPIHPTTNWWRMRGHKSFISFDYKPSPLVLERIVKSLTIPLSQCGSNDLNLWPSSNASCREFNPKFSTCEKKKIEKTHAKEKIITCIRQYLRGSTICLCPRSCRDFTIIRKKYRVQQYSFSLSKITTTNPSHQ